MGRKVAGGSYPGVDAFPIRLRSAIERAGGATRIAQLSGIPLSTLHNYLSGRSEPKRQAIASLARVLSVDPWWLLTGEERPASRLPERAGLADPDLLAAIVDGLLSLYDEIGRRPDGLSVGRKCGQIHNAIHAAGGDASDRNAMLRGAIALYRQELLDGQ